MILLPEVLTMVNTIATGLVISLAGLYFTSLFNSGKSFLENLTTFGNDLRQTFLNLLVGISMLWASLYLSTLTEAFDKLMRKNKLNDIIVFEDNATISISIPKEMVKLNQTSLQWKDANTSNVLEIQKSH